MPLRSRLLLIAVLGSVGVHLLAALIVGLLPRLLSVDAPPAEQGMVELLVVEQKGSQAGAAAQKESESRAQPDAAPAKTDPAKDTSLARQPLEAPASKQPEETMVLPPTQQTANAAANAPARPEDKPTPTEPAPAATQKAPIFNLDGTDSESDAVALGAQILPAKLDDRFRNRPPPYPVEAERLGEQGEVVVVIHVSEAGLASGVDLVESSGVQVLDQAAIAAVRKWRFHPAMRDGRTMPFDMPFRFVFERKS